MKSSTKFRRSIAKRADVAEAGPLWMSLFEQACECLDLIDRLTEEVAANLTVEGSKGQRVANPLLNELRQQRQAFARLIAQLGRAG